MKDVCILFNKGNIVVCYVKDGTTYFKEIETIGQVMEMDKQLAKLN